MYHPTFLKSEGSQIKKRICSQVCGIKTGSHVSDYVKGDCVERAEEGPLSDTQFLKTSLISIS